MRFRLCFRVLFHYLIKKNDGREWKSNKFRSLEQIYDKLNIVLIPENATMSRNSRCNEQ
jgi:hypothetical protein